MQVDWRGETEPAVATGDGVKEPLNRRYDHQHQLRRRRRRGGSGGLGPGPEPLSLTAHGLE